MVFLSVCKEMDMHDRHSNNVKILCSFGNEHEEMHRVDVIDSHAYCWARMNIDNMCRGWVRE